MTAPAGDRCVRGRPWSDIDGRHVRRVRHGAGAEAAPTARAGAAWSTSALFESVVFLMGSIWRLITAMNARRRGRCPSG